MYSLTYGAVIVGVVAELLGWLDVSIPVEALNTTINTLVAIVVGLVALYGRYRAGGVTVFGFRNKKR